VSFAASAGAYDRFMGRYSAPLAPLFCDFAGIAAGRRMLDVGCGPGALTAELITRTPAELVTAVDPSHHFVAAAAERFPGATVRCASAEDLPFADRSFDAALSQLVVHFMADPVAGLSEMSRVTQRNGLLAACVWDHGGGQGPLSLFWEAARSLDRDVRDESQLAGASSGQLARLLESAGLQAIEETDLAISVEHPSFEDWWQPFTLGVGPAGAYTAALEEPARVRLRERCLEMLPTPPFVVRARAWAARGVV
jgi:SAM-dependent methyltransferase